MKIEQHGNAWAIVSGSSIVHICDSMSDAEKALKAIEGYIRFYNLQTGR